MNKAPFSSTWWQRPEPRESDLTDRTDHEIHDIAPKQQLHSVTRSEASMGEELKMNQVLVGLGVAFLAVMLLKRG